MTGPAAASLYPFLSSGRGDLERVLEEVRRSTVAKAEEIIALRRTVLERDGERLVACAAEMAARFAAGGRLLAFGNGGSSTDAQDLARLFLSPVGRPGGSTPAGGPASGGRSAATGGSAVAAGPGAVGADGAAGGSAVAAGPGAVGADGAAGGEEPPALPAFALTNDIAVVTALTNDIGFDVVFARQIAAFGRATDIAVGLSTSGNSANLLAGLDEAARRGLLTVGISGADGGKMAELPSIDHLFVIPSASVHRIQEAQTTVYHALWELTVAALAESRGTPAGNGKLNAL